MPTCVVTRRLNFNAAHRVYDPALSNDENAELFGPCSHPNFHGHNYELDVSVEGEIDSSTGYVMDLGRLKALVERELLRHLDHRNLNMDVPFLQGVNPTAEQIAVACWRVLEPLVTPARLRRIRLWETPRNYVDYHGA
jgi:6-pyruvoyltetrahydropterin/6-carboxytetrahydropterin synthase